jgi:hypothetical protein
MAARPLCGSPPVMLRAARSASPVLLHAAATESRMSAKQPAAQSFHFIIALFKCIFYQPCFKA